MRLGLACLILVCGCDLYFNDPPECTVGAVEPAEQLRNPDTGTCESFGFGGCDPSCGGCPEIDFAPEPDWGPCTSSGCEGLDEYTCIGQSGCRAVYDANSEDDGGPRYLECWAIAPSGPVTGTCQGLDAYECSRHEDCSAFYDNEDGPLVYYDCRTEHLRDCIDDIECGDNAHCSTSDGECLPNPGCPDGSCPPVCFGTCVSDAGVCSGVSCAPGSHCEAQCEGPGGCSPVCTPDQDLCAAIDCAPGFACMETCQDIDPNNPGCGICDAHCVAIGTCESVTTEPACVARADCAAVYTGEDCTCDANGNCDCEVLTYARCQGK